MGELEKGQWGWELMRDVFKFWKDFEDVRPDGEYWKRLINQSAVYSRKYKEHDGEFANELLIAVINHLERVYKQGKEDVKDAAAK